MQSRIDDKKRTAERVRSFLRGEIVYNNSAMRYECTVRDFSDAGARLQVSNFLSLPEYFDLVIPQKSLKVRAKMIWIRAGEIGVTFLNRSTDDPARTPFEERPFQDSNLPKYDDLHERMKVLETELLKLYKEFNVFRQNIQQEKELK